MQRLTVFNHISLDGYFTDAKNDMGFARNKIGDLEWDTFVEGNAGGGGTMVFGRVTYEMMASFWPTPLAAETMPKIARRMNSAEKVVFSRKLKEAQWQNTRLVKTDPAGEIRRLKQEAGEGMVIFGSGSIVNLLAKEGLVDEFQFVLDPVALGAGRTMFEGLPTKLDFTLKVARTFKNGNVLLSYEPAG